MAKHIAPKMRITSMSMLRMPNGRLIRWPDIRRAYGEQIAGQGYSKKRIAEDLRKKRDAFSRVALALETYRATSSIRAAGREVGAGPTTVNNWFFKGQLPQVISPERHEFHTRTRQEVRALAKPPEGDFGYFLGLGVAGRIRVRQNVQTGKSRFAVSTVSPEIRNRIAGAFRNVFGIEPSIPKSRMRASSRRAEHSISLQSANLARDLTTALASKGSVHAFLPDHPKARLDFTRAIFDTGSSEIVSQKNYRAVHLAVPDAITCGIVTRSLSENGVGSEVRTIRGMPTVVIKGENLKRFSEHIGFTDQHRHQRIL